MRISYKTGCVIRGPHVYAALIECDIQTEQGTERLANYVSRSTFDRPDTAYRHAQRILNKMLEAGRAQLGDFKKEDLT